MNRLTLLRAQFEEALRSLLAEPEGATVFSVGCARWSDTVEWLARRFRWISLQSLPSALMGENTAVLIASEAPADTLCQWHGQLDCVNASKWRVLVVLGIREGQGQIASVIVSPAGQSEPLHELRLVGAGMHRMLISDCEWLCCINIR